MKKWIVLILAGFTFSPVGLGQTTISLWSFETSPPADLTDSATITGIAADSGSGTASGVHASALSDWTTPSGNGSANSLSVNTWAVGDYWQFQTSTVGFTGIYLSFDQTSSGTGPRDFELRYSNDGVNFTTFASYSVLANAAPNPVWNGTTPSSLYTSTYDLSSITSLDNDSDVYFRLVDVSTTSANGGTVAAGGTDRVDNFTVAQVPEPATFALAGIGVFALLLARRSR